MLTELCEGDILDNANLLQSNAIGQTGVSVRFEGVANPNVIPPVEYRELMRG